MTKVSIIIPHPDRHSSASCRWYPIRQDKCSSKHAYLRMRHPIFGGTLNPWNKRYTSSGSSGGEAALLACDALALGLTSGAGPSVRPSKACIKTKHRTSPINSLRIPTSYCGAFSLKPGHSRSPNGGMRDVAPGFEGVREVKGPMGRSVDDVELGSCILFGKPRHLDI